MSKPKFYKIVLQGCDDHTEIITDLTDSEVELIKTLAVMSETGDGCKPTMSVKEVN